MHKTSIYWFTNDLRVIDNASLCAAAENSHALMCIYIIDPLLFSKHAYAPKNMGKSRWTFLQESLKDLELSLRKQGQSLHIFYESPGDVFSKIISALDIHAVYTSLHAGYYENTVWQTLKKHYRYIEFNQHATHTLFTPEQLPFDIAQLPKSFSGFRKKVEHLLLDLSAQTSPTLPPAVDAHALLASQPTPWDDTSKNPPHHTLGDNFFLGGEAAASQHLDEYFASQSPSTYKETRNALDGKSLSTKFSPWLANGSLSVKSIVRRLKNYELTVIKNDSTYWIFFELLWREYFQWYAHKHQANLFYFRGIKSAPVLTSYYPERYKKWVAGSTPFALVNACMNQLKQTGFMSNRGRQIVASCFVNELELDWRYGAAYFEQELVDYDVASNWGNWQYLAGVGADPRGKRRFDIEKQTEIYDPSGTFIDKWNGAGQSRHLDSVDAADWPIN